MPATLKARVQFGSSAKRNQWVNAAKSKELSNNLDIRVEMGQQSSYGNNVAIAKARFATHEDAVALYELLVADAETRQPTKGSFARVTDEFGEILALREW